MFQKRVAMNKNMNNCYRCYYKKPCSNSSNKTRPGVSLLAFVLCLFIFFYGFIFHASDVSPCDAMRDVRFLFLFSNAIVLVIVADYGAFVSSSEEENVEESYGMVAAEEGPVPYNVVVKVGGYVEDGQVTKEMPVVGEDDVLVQAKSEEVKLLTYNGAGNVDGDVDGNEDGEGLRLVDEEEHVAEEGEENDEFSRMSDETDRDEDEEGSMATEEEERVVEEGEEDDEFSQMSDEELNKRVEEFIWRLKMQIRLQAARDTE